MGLATANILNSLSGGRILSLTDMHTDVWDWKHCDFDSSNFNWINDKFNWRMWADQKSFQNLKVYNHQRISILKRQSKT